MTEGGWLLPRGTTILYYIYKCARDFTIRILYRACLPVGFIVDAANCIYIYIYIFAAIENSTRGGLMPLLLLSRFFHTLSLSLLLFFFQG